MVHHWDTDVIKIEKWDECYILLATTMLVEKHGASFPGKCFSCLGSSSKSKDIIVVGKPLVQPFLIGRIIIIAFNIDKKH